MTYTVLMGTLNPTHSLTHSLSFNVSVVAAGLYSVECIPQQRQSNPELGDVNQLGTWVSVAARHQMVAACSAFKSTASPTNQFSLQQATFGIFPHLAILHEWKTVPTAREYSKMLTIIRKIVS